MLLDIEEYSTVDGFYSSSTHLHPCHCLHMQWMVLQELSENKALGSILSAQLNNPEGEKDQVAKNARQSIHTVGIQYHTVAHLLMEATAETVL